jgi:hypothetical protein
MGIVRLKDAEGLIQGPSTRTTQRTVKIKQKSIKLRGKTIYRTLPPKEHLLKIGLRGIPIYESCLEKN